MKTQFNKGHLPWNKGISMWNNRNHPRGMLGKISKKKGIPLSEEVKTKMRLAKIGRKLSEEHKHNIGKSLIGREVSINTRFKIANSLLGGHHKESTKKLIKEKLSGRKVTDEEIKKRAATIKRLYQLNLFIPPMFGKHHSKETKEKISQAFTLEKHPNWLGGKSFEPYGIEFNKRFKEAIKIRDNDSCMICGSDKRLTIHHIDYNKLNSTKENCILLCNSCHTKTNFNRPHWTMFFHSLLNEKYKYLEVSIL